MLRRALPLAIVLLASTARADVTVGVQLTPQGMRLANQLGVSTDELAARLRTQINNTLGLDGGALQAFSDAAVLSSHGLGADYVSMPESVIVGVAGSAATGNADVPVLDRTYGGLAANLAVMAGFNFAVLGHPRWTVYANGFHRSETVAQIDGTITNAGAHVQYAALLPTSDGIVRWSGLLVTSGLELTRWSLASSRTTSADFTVNGTRGSADVTIDEMGRVDVTSRSVTVPIEVSTGVRVAVVSLYAGAGVDITSGSGTLDAQATGPLTDRSGTALGQVTINGSASHGASPLDARVLAGVQLDAWKLKLFGHVNATTDTASVAVGVRGVL